MPDEVKARIVSESLRPGVTVNEIAERHGIKTNHLSSWRTLARQGQVLLVHPLRTQQQRDYCEGKHPCVFAGPSAAHGRRNYLDNRTHINDLCCVTGY
jgi:hypothetical protein